MSVTILKGSSVKKIPRMRTGIFTIDYIVGGGIPVGKVTEIYGGYSSGKSTLSLKIADAFLRRFDDSKVALVDFEDSFDSSWASKIVCDLDRVDVVKPAYGEVGLDFIIDSIEKKSNYSLYIIDSLAAVVPAMEADASTHDSLIGAQARLVSKFSRRLLVAKYKSGTEPTLLILNQSRVKVGVTGFASPIIQAGGNVHTFYASLIIRLYQRNVNDSRQTIQFLVEKNKVGGIPKLEGEFELFIRDHDGYRTGETRETKFIIDTGRATGFIVKDKGKYNLNEREFGSLAQIEDALDNDREFREWLKDAILSHVGF